MFPAASAQPGGAEEQRWYQVELLIFSHARSTNTERWPPMPQLAYPEAARFLVEPQLAELNLLRQETDVVSSEIDEFGRQLIILEAPQEQPGATGLTLENGDRLEAPGGLPYIEPDSSPGILDPNTAVLPLDPNAPPDPNDMAVEPTTPTPFVVLDSSEREFEQQAAQMSRSGRHEILFHQAWRQPVMGEASSLPIILDRSGDGVLWPRLQGSIKLYLSRYLHLQTDLWLNTDGDYLPGTWRMAPPPVAPPSLIVEQAEPDYLLDPNTPSPQAEWPSYTDEAESYPVFPDAALSGTALDVNTGLSGESMPEPTPTPLYHFRHAVALQQDRRMRSEEVHYVDHPLMGLVIVLTPLEKDTLRDLARVEAGLPPIDPDAMAGDQIWAP